MMGNLWMFSDLQGDLISGWVVAYPIMTFLLKCWSCHQVSMLYVLLMGSVCQSLFWTLHFHSKADKTWARAWKDTEDKIWALHCLTSCVQAAFICVVYTITGAWIPLSLYLFAHCGHRLMAVYPTPVSMPRVYQATSCTSASMMAVTAAKHSSNMSAIKLESALHSCCFILYHQEKRTHWLVCVLKKCVSRVRGLWLQTHPPWSLCLQLSRHTLDPVAVPRVISTPALSSFRGRFGFWWQPSSSSQLLWYSLVQICIWRMCSAHVWKLWEFVL